MKLSEALRANPAPPGLDEFLPRLSLYRYGYAGDLNDREGLASWLDAHPLIDVPVPEQKQRTAPIRPLQAEFRERLMEAYGECCAISGCRVAEVLDAAHLRSWREGSGVGDGILLRKDLHALLDAGLLTISRDYVVSVPPGLGPDYENFDGVKLRLPKRQQDWPRIR